MSRNTEYLTSAQLADRLKLHKDTPKSWRHKGRGPAWTKVGGAIRYRLDDVEVYEAARRGSR